MAGAPERWPFTSLDKACFSGTLAPWSSFAPTWRLVVRGRLTEAQVKAATLALLARYPLLASRVVPAQGRVETARALYWELDPSPRVEHALRVVDLRGLPPEATARREQALVDRFLDLTREYPFCLSWVRLADDRSALYLQQHHALADGRAFYAVCADLVDFLSADAGALDLPALARTRVVRRGELEVVEARGLMRVLAYAEAGAVAALELVKSLATQVDPLRCNVGQDYTGKNRTLHLKVPAARLEASRPAREDQHLSSHEVLTAALARALSRWSRRQGLPAGRSRFLIPVDVRPRDGGFESFANHLSSYQWTVDLSREAPLLTLARDLARTSASQRRRKLPHKKLLVEAPIVARMSMDALRRLVFEKRPLVTNYAFSNLLAMGIPGAGGGGRWSGPGFEVEDLLITTPCLPPQGANTTVVRYGDSLCFNFNYKDSVLSAAQMNDLGAQFQEELTALDRELAAVPSSRQKLLLPVGTNGHPGGAAGAAP